MNRQRRFTFGDRVQARLILNGRIVAEFISDRISDMTELLNAVRFRTRELRGLARLYVRNLTRGWADERPLMLYSQDLAMPKVNAQCVVNNSQFTIHSSQSGYASSVSEHPYDCYL